ncbi:hypothetical protein [Vibrio crassostreae]|uniref:hypothetical protein n=1 Tax=Vibrio crassostreae TaxID=246167 RepID=UPI001B304263|nr:hypothetical protein [Vibrio crassostreae]
MSNKIAGTIMFIMTDPTTNEILELGGAEFTSQADMENAWAGIPEFEGHSEFVADLMDVEGSIIDDKSVDAETICARLRAPIQSLIEKARKANKEVAHG